MDENKQKKAEEEALVQAFDLLVSLSDGEKKHAANHFEVAGVFPSKKEGRWLFRFALKGKTAKLLALLSLGVLIVFINFSLPFGVRYLFDDLIPNMDKTFLWQLGIGVLIALLASLVLQMAASLFIIELLIVSLAKVDRGFWDHLFKLPISFFKKYSPSYLWTSLSGFIQVEGFYNLRNLICFFLALFSFLYLIPMFYFSPLLTAIALLVTALILGSVLICILFMSRYYRTLLESKRKMHRFVYQIFKGFQKIRELRSESSVFAVWARYFAEEKKSDLKIQRTQAALSTLMFMIPIFSFLFFFSALMYADEYRQKITLGDFAGFLIAYVCFSAPLFAATLLFIRYGAIHTYWLQTKFLLEADEESTADKLRPQTLTGKIAMESVWFRYSPQGPYTLKNCSLYANPGECIAIAGASGSGKTTLLNLLFAFDKPEKGEITYDNISILHLDFVYLRRHVGALFQESAILEGSIYDNLLSGRVHREEEIEKALELSHFKEDLKRFPMGLHTLLINSGNTFSSGEKARLILARTLLSNPKVLLIGDIFTALDDEEYLRLVSNIKSLKRTAIIVSNRARALKEVDRIYFLKEGEIVESGTFDELIASRSHFAQFITA